MCFPIKREARLGNGVRSNEGDRVGMGENQENRDV